MIFPKECLTITYILNNLKSIKFLLLLLIELLQNLIYLIIFIT